MLTKEVILATDARVEELFAELPDPRGLYARFEAVWEMTERKLKRTREERKRVVGVTRGRGRGRPRGRGRGAAGTGTGSRTVSPQIYSVGADAMDVDPPAAKRVRKPSAVRRETMEVEQLYAEGVVVPPSRAQTPEPEPFTTTTTTAKHPRKSQPPTTTTTAAAVPAVSIIEKSPMNPLKLARLSKTKTHPVARSSLEPRKPQSHSHSTTTTTEIAILRRARTPLLFPGRTFTLHLTPTPTSSPSLHPPRHHMTTTKKNSRGRIDLDALWAAHWRNKGRVGENRVGGGKGVELGDRVRTRIRSLATITPTHRIRADTISTLDYAVMFRYRRQVRRNPSSYNDPPSPYPNPACQSLYYVTPSQELCTQLPLSLVLAVVDGRRAPSFSWLRLRVRGVNGSSSVPPNSGHGFILEDEFEERAKMKKHTRPLLITESTPPRCKCGFVDSWIRDVEVWIGVVKGVCVTYEKKR
ncbi:hypothetical protein G7K_5875-t3 [Saitoella complicata NRRL Y-17804]|uniref:Uncharacterized protein n=1 Tax=Saitoella complicata (strain BCRC 22490 / CBS 7301 / JCM 7358 / NBRC 10748 / NRRL Y-17804) TaxID=698492 RepID=A0A0E9NPL8_SAICN|nr:hypothetical protein G7K_5875-t3 [Saitoella complicata NRRL Y-17804]